MPVAETAIAALDRLLTQAFDALDAIAESGVDADLVALLTRCENVARRLDRTAVSAVAALERRGVFAEKGYNSSAAALADLLGWEGAEARRRVVAAEQVAPRIGLDGAALPARLPATAAKFADGRASLRHVEVIARVLRPLRAAAHARAVGGRRGRVGGQGRRLHALGAAGLGCRAGRGARPGRRRARRPAACTGQRAAPDPAGVRRRQVKGRFDDAAMFDAIVTVIDAKAKPLTADDERAGRAAAGRGAGRRVRLRARPRRDEPGPECGGRRPHVNVLVRLEDLENRARAACLDFGGILAPSRCGCCAATPRSCRSC